MTFFWTSLGYLFSFAFLAWLLISLHRMTVGAFRDAHRVLSDMSDVWEDS